MTRVLSVVSVVLMLAAACGDDESGDPPDAATGGTPDAAAGAPDAAPGTPDAAPGTPDAAPATPDAAPGTPDAAPATPDAAPTPDADPTAPDAAPSSLTTFRVDSLALRDPHAYFPLGCIDVTDTPLLGFSVNGQLATSVTMDEDGDDLLDISLVVAFDPLDQDSAGGDCDLGLADCTDPIGSTTCSPNATVPLQSTTYTNMDTGTCLGVLTDTESPEGYSPAIGTTTGPCFATAAISLTVSLAGVDVPLEDVEAAATYDGAPSTTLSGGLVRGFLSEDAAGDIMVPTPIGDYVLSSLLPGGDGSCTDHDDRDVGTDGTTMGWWFYFNFTAVEVPYTE